MKLLLYRHHLQHWIEKVVVKKKELDRVYNLEFATIVALEVIGLIKRQIGNKKKKREIHSISLIWCGCYEIL